MSATKDSMGEIVTGWMDYIQDDLTDDDNRPDDWDDTFGGMGDLPETGHRHTLTIAWDGDPADAKWYASSLAALAAKHVPGAVVTYTDTMQ